MKLVGYTDRMSARSGDTVQVMVSSDHPTFHAELVRLIHGDERPQGPGFKSERVDSSFDGEYLGRHQDITPGSYARIPNSGSLSIEEDFTIQMWIMPTSPRGGTQTLFYAAGSNETRVSLRLDEGRLTLAVGSESAYIAEPMIRGLWYFVAATYASQSGFVHLRVIQQSGIALCDTQFTDGQFASSSARVSGDIYLAAEPVGGQSKLKIANFYNGKIDSPRFFSRCLDSAELDALAAGKKPSDPLADWDFSLDINSSVVTDVSGHQNHGDLVNRPTRAVTGRNWDASTTSWRDAVHQYAAIHFHDDDLSDAGWNPSIAWTLPEGLPSGIYAVKLTSGPDEDHIPLIVVPHVNQARADIAVVIPTFSYLAYANEQMANGGTLSGLVQNYPRRVEDTYIVDNRLISLYDRHSDGSSVCYASWLRPLVNMRPKYTQHYLDNGQGSPHQFAADLHLIDWLVHSGYNFDVVTDLEVHHDGKARFEPYRVVLTGTHAEYTSGAMIDAYKGYLDGGGRLMYLSGNGMFWVTEPDAGTGTGIEIRRRGCAEWTWPVAPGEAHLSSTGELGGIWSTRGRSTHDWLGVGYCGEGTGPGRPFKRTETSNDPRAQFVFDGIAENELIGDFPSLVNGWGAAGFEVDYADPVLMPQHALILATAEGFGEEYEVGSSALSGGAAQHPKMQANLVLLEYPNDGAVFSFSSISWAAGLSYNDYDNNVARLTRNVLDGFLSTGCPPWQAY
ncbi:N,N-dimethylformamidase beta subunit [Rhodococcus fascians]|uniref:LamG domain-containing protein n=1 Tax=Rhodococcoides fascians TaxID=1828 RepID=UPI001427ACC8|nr:N,N-dimethylformamidase beta subunit [Rhodococcus fascians]